MKPLIENLSFYKIDNKIINIEIYPFDSDLNENKNEKYLNLYLPFNSIENYVKNKCKLLDDINIFFEEIVNNFLSKNIKYLEWNKNTKIF